MCASPTAGVGPGGSYQVAQHLDGADPVDLEEVPWTVQRACERCWQLSQCSAAFLLSKQSKTQPAAEAAKQTVSQGQGGKQSNLLHPRSPATAPPRHAACTDAAAVPLACRRAGLSSCNGADFWDRSVRAPASSVPHGRAGKRCTTLIDALNPATVSDSWLLRRPTQQCCWAGQGRDQAWCRCRTGSRRLWVAGGACQPEIRQPSNGTSITPERNPRNGCKPKCGLLA